MIYIVNMVIRYTENNVFLGLSRTFDGCLDILRDHFPAQTNLEKLSHSPTGTSQSCTFTSTQRIDVISMVTKVGLYANAVKEP